MIKRIMFLRVGSHSALAVSTRASWFGTFLKAGT